MESDKNIKASGLINRFRSLVKHAESVAFPQAKNSIFLPVNTETWHPIRRVLYKASAPYFYANEKHKGAISYFFLSLFILIMTFSVLVLAEKTAKTIPIEADWLQFSFLVTYLFLSLYGVLSFLRDPRYPVAARIFIVIIFVVASAATTAGFFPVTPTGVHVIASFTRYLKVLLLMFSVLSFVFLYLINTFLIALLAFVQLLRFTKTIQTPTTDESIEELLHAEIGDVNLNGQTWHLLDLSKNEITYLLHWSESNLSSSEKRTTPAIVVVALAGLLLSVDGVRNFIASSFKITSIADPQSWLAYLLLIIVFSFIVIFSDTMVAIFKNIAIQSLIVEACLVAEYAVDENKEIQVKEGSHWFGNLLMAIIQKIIK